MDMQLLNFIIQPLLGGAAGYITNEYAINMLFNTYTPFKLGGVIPKTREEFIENISKLVEEDIINKEKVEAILSDEAFIKNFDILIEDFFAKSLYETSDNLKLKNIPSISSALDEIQDFANNQVSLELPKITELLSKEIKLEKLLDKKQTTQIIDSLYSYILDTAKNSDLIDKLVSYLIENNKDLTIKEAIGDNIANTITNNISNNFFNISELKSKYNEDIDKIINELLLRTNLYNSLSYFVENLVATNRKTILNLTSTNIAKFISSKDFNEIIVKFSSSLLDYGKSINIPLLDLVNDNFIDKIKQTIINQAPSIFELLIDFAKQNNVELQNIIEEAVDEAINEQDATKKTLLGMAKGSIIGSISKNDIASTLENILQDKNNIENISLIITVKIKQLLKNTSIADLIIMLEKKNILTSTSLSNFIVSYTTKNTNNLVERILDSVSPLLKSRITVNFINNNIKKIIKDKLLFSNNLIGQVNNSLNKLIDNYLNKELKEVLNNLDIEQLNFKDCLINVLENSKEKLTKGLSNSLNNYIHNKSIFEIIDSTALSNINQMATGFAKNKLNELKLNASNLEFYELINGINNIDGIQKNSSTILRNLITNNLDNLLQNFIKGLAVNNLNKLDDDKLCEMAKSFMGNNLKPIMLFGGMLGIIAGVILAVLQPEANVFAPFSIPSALTYSLVGYLTNAIAINMLFKPYNEIKPIRNIPFLRHFSLGYIVKNKEVLADSMSYAINEYLLTKDSMNELIDINNDKIKNSMLESMSKNNYEMLSTISINNKTTILKTLDKYIIDLIHSNLDNISNACINELDKLKVNSMIVGYKDKFAEYTRSAKHKYNNLILTNIEKLTHSNASIASVIPKSVLDNIKKTVDTGINNSFDIVVNKLNYQDLNMLIKNYDSSYQSYLNKPLLDLLPNKNLQAISKLVLIKAKDLGITHKLVAGINTRLNTNIAIGEMFNGGISKLSNNALENFFDNTAINSETLLAFIKPSVSKAVQNKVTSNLSFLVRGAYNMMDGNKIVDLAVEKVLLTKLPKLIEANKDKLYKDSQELLNSKLLNINLKDFELDMNPSIIESTISGFIEDENTDKIKEMACTLIDAIKTKSSNATLKDMLKPLGLDSLNTAFESYKPELTELLNELNTMLSLSKSDLTTMLQELSGNYLNNTISSTSINTIFKGISDSDLNNLSNNIANILTEEAFITDSIDLIISTIENSDESIAIFDFINKDDLSQDFKNIARNLVTNDRAREVLKDILNNIFDNATQDGFSFVNNDAKNYFINILTDASILSLRNNLNIILKDVEFDKIAKEQINAMKPKKIHMMFNSFAGKYFRTLMFYGIFGAVFGINIPAGLVLAGAYGIKKIVKKET